MGFNFDEILSERHESSIKHCFAAERGMPDGLIPLWVADMDFKTAPPVSDALITYAEQAVFGYSEGKCAYFEAVRNWFSTRFEYTFQPEWMVKTPGVVFALCMAIRAFTKEGDGILIQPPVYYPFKKSIEANGRRVVNQPLRCTDGVYSIDFDEFERKIVSEKVKMFILCSPHNPVGRVWRKEELTQMDRICRAHGVLVVCDEIHCDFVYKGGRHHVFYSLGSETADNTILCTAPGKTFNMAGLQVANIFIANEQRRNLFVNEIDKTGYCQLNGMGLVACRAAYEHGGPWFDALMDYLYGSLHFVRDFVRTELPGIRLTEPEGTYLIWLDFNALGLSETALRDLMVNKAKLWVDPGSKFGEEGRGFIRINMATPRATIEKAMQQIKNAIT